MRSFAITFQLDLVMIWRKILSINTNVYKNFRNKHISLERQYENTIHPTQKQFCFASNLFIHFQKSCLEAEKNLKKWKEKQTNKWTPPKYISLSVDLSDFRIQFIFYILPVYRLWASLVLLHWNSHFIQSGQQTHLIIPQFTFP